MLIEINKINSSEIYNLMIGSILPRPIAWVGSSSNGIDNLAAFSFFNVASVNPPIINFSILNKINGEQKATLNNIEESKYFSISIVSEDLVEKMAKSSKQYDEIIDKFEICDLTKKDCNTIPSFYVKEAKVSYECRLREVINFGNNDKAGNLVLGDIIAINIDDKVLDYPQIDIEKLNPIGRLSKSFYTNIKSKFEIKRD